MTWDDVLTAALLGTDRRALDPADLPRDLGAAGARLPATDAPGRLLGAAVLLTTARRAGTTGARSERPAPEPAPPETAAIVGGAARERLAGLLARSDAEGVALLAEWLQVAAERGLVAPPALLPHLLDLRRPPPRARPPVRAVLGERGRWLRVASTRRGSTTAAADDGRPSRGRPAPDEADLDAALSDRSPEVRATALDPPAQLPGASSPSRSRTGRWRACRCGRTRWRVRLPARRRRRCGRPTRSRPPRRAPAARRGTCTSSSPRRRCLPGSARSA